MLGSQYGRVGMGAITLQFATTDDVGSWAIRTFQRGWCSHVDSVMDDGRLLGVRLAGGVQIRPAHYATWSRVERVVIEVPALQEAAYWAFPQAQVGKPYDTLAIAAFAFNRNWRTPDAWFCDELVAAGSNMPVLCTGSRRLSIVSTCATCI
jgi:hypothetical protein